jgi:hypothetical protein
MTDIDPDPTDIDLEFDPDENINDENPEDDGDDAAYYNTELPTGDLAAPVNPPEHVALFAAAPSRTYQILEDILEFFPDHKHVYVTSTTGGKHAKNSYHYRGEAIDVGSTSQEYKDKLAAWLYPHYGLITELIHSKAGNKTGWYVKKGKRVGHGFYGSATTAAHVNHVHFAVASVDDAKALLTAVTPAGFKKQAPPGKPAFPGVLKHGSDGPAVKVLQLRLNARGYRPSLPGITHFGPKTEDNVKKFQKFAHLPQTGAVDLKTFNLLWDLKITPA